MYLYLTQTLKMSAFLSEYAQMSSATFITPKMVLSHHAILVMYCVQRDSEIIIIATIVVLPNFDMEHERSVGIGCRLP